MVSSMLQVEHLTAGYGSVEVCWDVSLEVKPGEVVCLLGPNGAGKTTMLLTIAGFLRRLNGSIKYLDVDVADASPSVLARRGLTILPDDKALTQSLTVRETLSLVRDQKDDPYKLFPELLQLRRRRCGLLSGGEQMMVGLARALSGRPRLLLVDELSQGLSPVAVQRLFPALRTVADEHGAGVLVVEQAVSRALSVSDRAYVMNQGRVVIHDRSVIELREDRNIIASAYLGETVLPTSSERSA